MERSPSLADLAADLERRDELRARLAALDTGARDHESRRVACLAEVERAAALLRRAEHPGLFSRLFTPSRGSAAAIDAARTRLQDSKQRHDACDGVLERLGRRRQDLRAKIAALGDIDMRYVERLREKERALLSGGGDNAQRVAHSARRVEELEAAAASASDLLALVHDVAGLVQHAEDALTFEVIPALIGGRWTHYMRRRKLAAGLVPFHAARRRVAELVTALGALEPPQSADVTALGEFAEEEVTTGFFSWQVRENLARARELVAAARAVVERLAERLGARAEEAVAARDGARRAHERWVVGAE